MRARLPASVNIIQIMLRRPAGNVPGSCRTRTYGSFQAR
jgi:hypothetical protein